MAPVAQAPLGKVRRAVWRSDSRGRGGRYVEEFVGAAAVAVAAPGRYALRDEGGVLRIVEQDTGVEYGIAASREIGENVVRALNGRGAES